MAEQGPRPKDLVEVPRLPWGTTLWRSVGVKALQEGYDAMKASLGGKFTQEEFARQISATEGNPIPVSLSLLNNWMQGRGLPPESVARVMLQIVKREDKVFGPRKADEEHLTSADLRLVLNALASSPQFTNRHGTDYATVYDRALAIVKQALNEKRAVSTLSTLDVIGYASAQI